MKLIILTVMCIGIVHVKADCNTIDDKPEGCYCDEVGDRIARIVCKNTDACECTNSIVGKECSPDIISQEDLAGLTADVMDGPKCRDLCEASKLSTSQCEYFRWEENYDSSKQCSFMNSVQCKNFEPCTGKHCLSGQVGCSGGQEPEPTGKSCAAEAEFIDNAVHWKCVNPFDDSDHDRIDIYGTELIPAGSMCFTDHKCVDFDIEADDEVSPDFLYHTYVVECVDGNWVKYGKSTNDPSEFITDDVPNKLTDPTNCDWYPKEDLELDEAALTESGVSLICSKGENLVYSGEGTVTVKAPNTCALLCNFHHVMTIEPKYQETDGTTKWWMYPTGDDVGKEATKEEVHCWEN